MSNLLLNRHAFSNALDTIMPIFNKKLQSTQAYECLKLWLMANPLFTVFTFILEVE